MNRLVDVCVAVIAAAALIAIAARPIVRVLDAAAPIAVVVAAVVIAIRVTWWYTRQ
ncbi:MAG: hypothetical protein ABSG64_07700 [Solirubrobacteraceae bacterium]|jgi:hypothetical protein